MLLTQIEAFLTIAERRSVSEAAGVLYVTQPALDLYPQTLTKCLDKLAEEGLLGPNVLAAHCVHVDEGEMRALKNIDVAFVPMNIPVERMTPHDAADCVMAALGNGSDGGGRHEIDDHDFRLLRHQPRQRERGQRDALARCRTEHGHLARRGACANQDIRHLLDFSDSRRAVYVRAVHARFI